VIARLEVLCHGGSSRAARGRHAQRQRSANAADILVVVIYADTVQGVCVSIVERAGLRNGRIAPPVAAPAANDQVVIYPHIYAFVGGNGRVPVSCGWQAHGTGKAEAPVAASRIYRCGSTPGVRNGA